jgi:hypothetical protein
MTSQDPLQRGPWQFSLRTLLFLMSVVAFCSMLIGVSAVLAIVVVPFFAMALIRTLRLNQPLPDGAGSERKRRGLFATFFASFVLIITLVAVSIATAGFALATAGLIVLDLVARCSTPVIARLQLVLKRVWRMSRVATGHLASFASYSNIRRALHWTSAHARSGTRQLVAATGVLHRRYWKLDLRK